MDVVAGQLAILFRCYTLSVNYVIVMNHVPCSFCYIKQPLRILGSIYVFRWNLLTWAQLYLWTLETEKGSK
jgi:hypothetical protein